jgi:hypothetical protein
MQHDRVHDGESLSGMVAHPWRSELVNRVDYSNEDTGNALFFLAFAPVLYIAH